MYTTKEKRIVTAWAKTLQKTDWDIFSTITYLHDIKPSRNEKIMYDLEKYLKSLKIKFNLFWVMEHTNRNISTHNHLLIKGNRVEKEIEYHLRNKKLIGNQVKHVKYNIGASYYVSKYMCDREVKYGII